MAESIQRILKRRDGQHATRPEEIIAWLEAAARGWNREPRRSSGVANARPDEHGLARAARVSVDQASGRGDRSPDHGRPEPMAMSKPTDSLVYVINILYSRDMIYDKHNGQLKEHIEFLKGQLVVKDGQLANPLTDVESWREQVRYKELQVAQLQDRMIPLPFRKESESTEQGSERGETLQLNHRQAGRSAYGVFDNSVWPTMIIENGLPSR
jgi:hypothetical protein